MSRLFALYTSDPNLIRCELTRLAGQFVAGAAGVSSAGVGSYAQDEVLLQRFAGDVELAERWEGPESEALLYLGDALPLGVSPEDNSQPYRFRRWLFGHYGAMSGFSDVRSRLLASLPDFLRRSIKGDLPGEAAFAAFVRNLRDVGRLDDDKLESAVAAQILGKTARWLEQLAKDCGVKERWALDFVASNGRLLVASRLGDLPLYYALLEGSDRCQRCGLDSQTPDGHPLKREHRRQRSVALSSVPGKSGTWIEVAAGSAIAVDSKLAVQTFPI